MVNYMENRPYYYDMVSSPIGELTLLASDKGLCALEFAQKKGKKLSLDGILHNAAHPVLIKAKKQLSEYFAGKRKQFDLPLEMNGSVFQQKAWRELQKIPYGQTISYGEQAARMGDAKKARAAGMANGRNPLAIIVPCHRVIGASGALTGFAGGISVKKQLLDLETRFAA